MSLIEDGKNVVLIKCDRKNPKEPLISPLLCSLMRIVDRLLGSTCHQQSWPWMSSKIVKSKLAITRGCIKRSQNGMVDKFSTLSTTYNTMIESHIRTLSGLCKPKISPRNLGMMQCLVTLHHKLNTR